VLASVPLRDSRCNMHAQNTGYTKKPRNNNIPHCIQNITSAQYQHVITEYTVSVGGDTHQITIVLLNVYSFRYLKYLRLFHRKSNHAHITLCIRYVSRIQLCLRPFHTSYDQQLLSFVLVRLCAGECMRACACVCVRVMNAPACMCVTYLHACCMRGWVILWQQMF